MRVGVKLMRTDKKAGLGWPKGDALTEPSSKHFWGKVSLEERHLLNLTTSAHCLKILSDTLVCSWHGPNSLTWPPRSCMVWPLHLSFSTLPPYHRLLWLISFNMATCSIFPQGLCNKMFPLPQIGSPPIFFFFFLACPTWSSGHSLKNHVLQWHCPTPQICAPFRGIDSPLHSLCAHPYMLLWNRLSTSIPQDSLSPTVVWPTAYLTASHACLWTWKDIEEL